MQWSLGRAASFVLVIGLGLGIYRIFGGDSSYFDSRITFAGYLAILTTASLAAYESRPRWRRFWLGYISFGWAYLLLVLRAGFGFTPDVFAGNLSRFSFLGMLLGVMCAITTSLIPGLREVREDDGFAHGRGRH
jgi:hypothetical protein